MHELVAPESRHQRSRAEDRTVGPCSAVVPGEVVEERGLRARRRREPRLPPGDPGQERDDDQLDREPAGGDEIEHAPPGDSERKGCHTGECVSAARAGSGRARAGPAPAVTLGDIVRLSTCRSPDSNSIPACSGASRSSASPVRRHPGRRDSARARRPRRARLRHDRQRQDRRVPAADPPRLMDKPRGTTRALVLTPTRELAAQILERPRTISPCTRRVTGAAVFGGVGMGPQEHAFRSGVDVIVGHAGPAARSLPLAVREARRPRGTWCSTRPTACSTWASCPTSAACCATCRREAADAVLQRDDAARRSRRCRARCCSNPVHDQPRAPGGAGRRHHAGGLPGARRS